jgi:hypothetical protein
VHLNLSVLLFDQGEYRDSVKHLTRLYMLDSYKTADDSLKLKIAACELIARYELDQSDVVDYKLKSVRREFREQLRTEAHYPEKELFDILKRLMGVIRLKEEPVLLERIRAFIDWTGKNRREDSQIIDYHNWLLNLLQKARLNA